MCSASAKGVGTLAYGGNATVSIMIQLLVTIATASVRAPRLSWSETLRSATMRSELLQPSGHRLSRPVNHTANGTGWQATNGGRCRATATTIGGNTTDGALTSTVALQ